MTWTGTHTTITDTAHPPPSRGKKSKKGNRGKELGKNMNKQVKKRRYVGIQYRSAFGLNRIWFDIYWFHRT